MITGHEPYKLLTEMKEEQNQNEKTLMYLRRRLVYPDRYFNLNKIKKKKNIYLIYFK